MEHSLSSTQRSLRRSYFWKLLLLTNGISVAVLISLYFFFSAETLRATQDQLKQIAVHVANVVPVEVHEKLVDSDQISSEEYTSIEKQFQDIMTGNADIDDIYTLRPTSREGYFTFVVSGMETNDANGDGYLDDAEVKPALGEEYDARNLPSLINGMTQAGYDFEITTDKWGNWLSGYAPLRDANGKAVAVVGVDYSANVLVRERESLLLYLLFIQIGLFFIYVLFIWFITGKIIRPFVIFSNAIQAEVEGKEHELESVKKYSRAERKVFEMYHFLSDALKRSAQKKQD